MQYGEGLTKMDRRRQLGSYPRLAHASRFKA